MNDSNIIEIKPLGFQWATQDPFLFSAYHKDEYPVGNEKLGPDTFLLEVRNIGQGYQISSVLESELEKRQQN